jgi:hypothetical protein
MLCYKYKEKRTPWHFGEEMMHNVIMCNIMPKEATLPAQYRPVNGCRCATLEIPFFSAVMR